MAQDPNAALRVVKAMFAAAEAGDVSAARELFDRIEGKPVARTELSGANGAALFPVVAINVTGIEPGAVLEHVANAASAPLLLAQDAAAVEKPED